MENLSVEDVAKKIEIYFKQNASRPYFVICEDAEKIERLKKKFSGLDQIYLSNLITSAVEHKAVLNSCAAMKNLGCTIIKISVDKFGEVDIDEIEKKFAARPS